MASSYPEFTHHHASSRIPQSSNYTYFLDQAVRAGYIRPESGQHHHFESHHRQQNAVPYPGEMHSVIQRELEKEQMRQEIIRFEILRLRARLIEEREREMALLIAEREREMALLREREMALLIEEREREMALLREREMALLIAEREREMALHNGFHPGQMEFNSRRGPF